MMNNWKLWLFCPREQRVLWTRWDTRTPLSLRSRDVNQILETMMPSWCIKHRCSSWSPLKQRRLGRKDRRLRLRPDNR